MSHRHTGAGMHCARCGTTLEFAGQGHTCRSVAPEVITAPTGWVVVTWLLAGFALLYSVFGVAIALLSSAIPARGTPMTVAFALLAVALLLGWLLSLTGSIITLIMWNRRTQLLADRCGFDSRLVVKGWIVRAFVLTVIVAVCLQGGAGYESAISIWVVTGIRVIAGLLLVGNVLVAVTRVLNLIADANRQMAQAHG